MKEIDNFLILGYAVYLTQTQARTPAILIYIFSPSCFNQNDREIMNQYKLLVQLFSYFDLKKYFMTMKTFFNWKKRYNTL